MTKKTLNYLVILYRNYYLFNKILIIYTSNIFIYSKKTSSN